MLNYVPQVGTVCASVDVLQSVHVSESDKCERRRTEQRFGNLWCRNQPSGQLCDNEVKLHQLRVFFKVTPKKFESIQQRLGDSRVLAG